MLRRAFLGYLLGLVLLFLPAKISAHNAQLATFHIIQQEKQWVLKIALAQATVENTLRKNNPKIDLAAIPRAEYQSLILQYLVSTIEIQANEKEKIILENGFTETDGHQHNSYFRLDKMPPSLSSLELKINSFAGEQYHANIVRVYYFPSILDHSSLKKQKIALNPENNFQATMRFE